MVTNEATAQPADGAPEHPILTRVAPPPDRTTRYGPGSSHLYDVRLPPARGRGDRDTTVVVLHGGFWRDRVDRTHAGSQAQAYADDGFHVVVPEYRRTGSPGGGWPGTFDDVSTALAAIRADPQLAEAVVLVGHSAGGHLAVWLLSQPEGEGLRGAVSLAGCVDLGRTARDRLGDGAALDLMGGGPDDLERYATADPARLVPAPAPVHLVHGEDDTTVPLSISRSYQRISAAAGRTVPLTVIPGAGHFELIDPDDPAFAPGLAAVRALAGAG
jgi:acetyl esterase/lipase